MPPPPLGIEAARRLLARAAYGARTGEAERVGRLTTPDWLDAQFALPVDNPAVTARVAALAIPIRYPAGPGEQMVDELRPLTTLAMTHAQRWAYADGRRIAGPERDRPRAEFVLATIARKAIAPDQLRERMMEFWHDHFSVAAQAAPHVAVSLAEHDSRIRRHAFGNFTALLEAVATSPAMLAYLNNRSSRAGAPNENYARELMELHTLGAAAYHPDARAWRDVPGAADGRPAGYFDGDVWEAARAFTGWTISAGQRLDAVQTLPNDGAFAYVERWHDGYQKRVLGQEFTPFSPAMADGRKVIELCATHPATARHVCAKLARFLIGDPPPPAAVQRATEAFIRHRDAPDQIARMIRALLDGPEATDPAHGRVRRPLELTAAAVRMLDIPFTAQPILVGEMARAGQFLFGWPTPDGQPLGADHYLGGGTLRARWGLLLGLAQNAWNTGLSPHIPALSGKGIGEAAYTIAVKLVGREAPAVAQQLASAWAVDRRPDRLRNPQEAALLAGLALLAPGFQTT